MNISMSLQLSGLAQRRIAAMASMPVTAIDFNSTVLTYHDIDVTPASLYFTAKWDIISF